MTAGAVVDVTAIDDVVVDVVDVGAVTATVTAFPYADSSGPDPTGPHATTGGNAADGDPNSRSNENTPWRVST